MAILAIKGHQTKGNEVIEILEMLGGVNRFQREGDNKDRFYYIDKNKYIQTTCDSLSYALFTLEEFLEKFPYKIGDKILYKTYGIYLRIKTMLWNVEKERVFYRLGSNKLFVATADELKTNKEEIMENKPDLLQQLKDYFDNTPREVVEKEWHEYDKYNEIGPTVNEYLKYVNKIRQPKYPKTYEECCEVLMGKTNFSDFSLVLTKLSIRKNEENSISPEPPYISLINKFYKLLICRDAYWKIAGEQMGLGKPWAPDYTDKLEKKYSIGVDRDEIVTGGAFITTQMVLTFPTEETRDSFYGNFKELIEECKELL